MIELIDELILQQRKKIFRVAQRIVPQITEEDLLQPNDFPELELHPHFRHEEGILDGMMMVRMAILASQNNETYRKYKSNGSKKPGLLV